MLSNASITPTIYTGPLKTNFGNGVSESEGRALNHAARVMLGQALSAADAVGLKSTSAWHTFENGVTVRVARLGTVHLAEFVRHPVVEAANGGYEAYGLTPYGGVVVDGYYDVEETGIENPPTITLLDRFSPSADTLKRLTAQYNRAQEILSSLAGMEGEAVTSVRERLQLQMRYLHHDSDVTLRQVSYLPLRVPDQWAHLYNNPVQPNPLAANPKPPRVYAAQRLIKPTMYSGRMRVVAQVLLGLGRFPEPSREQLSNTHSPTDCWCGASHTAQEILKLANLQRGVENYPHDKKDDKKDDVPPEDKLLGSLNYWFHWFKTHGVYKSQDGRYYLIEISEAGVWAMRLPVIYKSGWEMSDEAKEHLPALPLGYPLPSKEATLPGGKSPFDKAVEEGWVKKLLSADEVAPFYEKLMPSYLECGWAFSMSGAKIDNVGWRYNGPRPYDYPVFEHWHIDISGGDAGPSATDLIDYNHDIDSVGFDSSIENLRATINKVGQGNALDVAQYNQCLKVPTIDDKTGIPSVISFDMMPAGWPKSGNNIPDDYRKALPNYPISDTTIHVFYDGEELVWTRFYNPMNTAKTEHDSWDDRDYTPYCMLLGSWTWGDYNRNVTKPKGFYTSRNDPRKIADETRNDMQSQGSKTWESPYMGVEYSWPYPPFHFGYEQSNAEGEWYNDFDASYRSRVGSPWTAKRHCFHVHVYGTRVTGQAYSYSCAIPLTDREVVFICERHVAATRSKVDYKYAAMVMQFVYYTYPAWIPDYELGIDHHIIPVGEWPEWQLRDDTVKYLMWMFFDAEHNYTNEEREPPQTVLNIASGTHTAPLDTWDRSKPETAVEDYKILTECSKLGGEYPTEMKGDPGADQLWEWTLPNPTDSTLLLAHLWCTRSMLGTEGSKQHVYLNGKMSYTGFRNNVLTDMDKAGPHRQVTFIGET
jgi:hypothetical protein